MLTNLLHRTLLTIEAVIEEITHETVNWGFNILICHRQKITDGTVTDDIADSTDTDGNIDSKVIRNIIDDITN